MPNKIKKGNGSSHRRNPDYNYYTVRLDKGSKEVMMRKEAVTVLLAKAWDHKRILEHAQSEPAYTVNLHKEDKLA